MALDTFYNVFNIKYQERGTMTHDAFGSKFDWMDINTIPGGILALDSGGSSNTNPILADTTHTLQIPPQAFKNDGRIVIDNEIYTILYIDNTISALTFDKHVEVYLRKEGIENG